MPGGRNAETSTAGALLSPAPIAFWGWGLHRSISTARRRTSHLGTGAVWSIPKEAGERRLGYHSGTRAVSSSPTLNPILWIRACREAKIMGEKGGRCCKSSETKSVFFVTPLAVNVEKGERLLVGKEEKRWGLLALLTQWLSTSPQPACLLASLNGTLQPGL